ncbi:MAG: hypothetical protein KIT26_08925 [Nitrosomonas sp.]|nr:hypothetical protein [Nitrosomonas sp.]
MIRLFKKKPNIISSRMVVRPYISWPFRLMVVMVTCFCLLLLSWGMYEAGKRTATGKTGPASQIKQKEWQWHNAGECLEKDGETLCTQLVELTRQFQILQTTNDDLVKQTKQLSKENSLLKGELDFFEHVMTGNTKLDSGVAIHHFNLKKDNNSDVYRYSLSLVQGGPRTQEFNGHLKFLINLRQNEQRKKVMLTNQHAQQNFPVHFKFYHRIEENFKAPSDMEVESIEVQIFEKNDRQARLTKTVELSL